jgi:hypothetical protein
MEAMLGISLSLSQASGNAVFLIISYVFSSTKLEKRAEHVLPGSEGGTRTGRGSGAGRVMTQKMYTHGNNCE